MVGVILRGAAVFYGAAGVLLAAFGAHGLEKITDARGVRLWAIAVALELVTAPVLLFCSREVAEGKLHALGPILIAVGLGIFSGTLYAMALGAPKFLGAFTPLGGLLLAIGWALLVWVPR